MSAMTNAMKMMGCACDPTLEAATKAVEQCAMRTQDVCEQPLDSIDNTVPPTEHATVAMESLTRKEKSSDKTAAIVGGVLGAFIGLLICLVLFLLWKMHNGKSSYAHWNDKTDDPRPQDPVLSITNVSQHEPENKSPRKWNMHMGLPILMSPRDSAQRSDSNPLVLDVRDADENFRGQMLTDYGSHQLSMSRRSAYAADQPRQDANSQKHGVSTNSPFELCES